MLRRNLLGASALLALPAALLSAPAFAADFTCQYFKLPLKDDWKHQPMQKGAVPPSAFAALFASQKFGEGVLITVMPSNATPGDAARQMADSYQKQGMKVVAGPVQIPGQNAYRFTYTSRNAKMHAIVIVSGNGKMLAQTSLLGRQGTHGMSLMRGLQPQVKGLFPKF